MHPKYTKEDFARMGDEIYDRKIASQTAEEDAGKFVVIDVESEDFEMDTDEVAASDRLLSRHPDAQIWLRRVGSRYARFAHLVEMFSDDVELMPSFN